MGGVYPETTSLGIIDHDRPTLRPITPLTIFTGCAVDWCSDELDESVADEPTDAPPSVPASADFCNELPIREVLEEEWPQAACTGNVAVHATNRELRHEPYLATNTCVNRSPSLQAPLPQTAWRPQHPDGAWDPVLLFTDFTFSTKHGDYVRRFLPAGQATCTMTGPQIWEGILKWFADATKDVHYSCSTELGGGRHGAHSRHTLRAKLWVIPNQAMSPEARDLIWDLRSFYADPSAGIHPIQQGDERRDTGLGAVQRQANIAALQREFQCPDGETPARMVSGVCTHSDAARRDIVLGPNYKGFYAEVDFAVQKNRDEQAAGVIQGPFQGPCFLPCRVFPNNVAIQANGKKRRTGDGGFPRDFLFEGEDISLNNAIDIDDETAFPAYELPTAVSFARNLQIASMCALAADATDSLDESGGDSPTGDPDLQMHVLLTDWVAYYRVFVLNILYFWTQLNVYLPEGCTVDTALYFGDKGAPCFSNHAMNWLLFIWKCLFRQLLEPLTSWDCAAATPRAAVGAWDINAGVRRWRQHRYDQAIEAGMSEFDAFFQSIPAVFQGYFDDGQTAVARALMPVLIQSLFSLVNQVGIQVEYSKMVWATPDGQVGSFAIREGVHTPRGLPDVLVTFEIGSPVILGKELAMPTKHLQETAKRCADTSAVASAMAVKSHDWTSNIRSFIGKVMYIVLTIPTLRGALNSPIQCMKAETRLAATRTKARNKFHNDEQVDYLVPLSNLMQQSLQFIASVIRSNPGRAFATKLEAPTRHNTIFIMNDAAGFGGFDDTSFRGGASWIIVPGLPVILWCVQHWPLALLFKAHSTELEVINANCTLEAIATMFPQFNICEVLDNQAGVACLKKMACSSASLILQMDMRRRIIDRLLCNRRVFTIWSERELGTLADMLSKGLWASFHRGLAARRLPPPAANPIDRRDFNCAPTSTS